jgi:hypothetical protein
MRIAALVALSISCAACGIYQTKWDCPPGEGVRCKPVSDVMEMIVEKDDGQDLFIKDLDEALAEKQKGKKRKQPSPPSTQEDDKKLYLLRGHSGEPLVAEAAEVTP